MLEPISIGIIGAVVGYLSGHLHARVSGSSCLYGCCKFDELDTDFSLMKDEQNIPKKIITSNINDK